jgi:hypothetical protein
MVYYFAHKIPVLQPIPNLIKPAHTLILYFLIQHNIIFPYIPVSGIHFKKPALSEMISRLITNLDQTENISPEGSN